ncbi:MAG: four-helix bundle copper-binding protein, partial [Paracoccaceae bacterium]
MSIKEMINEHPDVAGHMNEPLAEAVKHAMYCAAICNSCADACGAEDGDRRDCIRSCMDCS